MKVGAEVDTKLVAETIEEKGLVIEVVVVDEIDRVDKHRGIALL